MPAKRRSVASELSGSNSSSSTGGQRVSRKGQQPPAPPSSHSTSPLYTYWTDRNRNEDEALAKELLRGRRVLGGVGRTKIEYLRHGSPRERLAREALVSLLHYYTRRDDDLSRLDIVEPLCSALIDVDTAPFPNPRRLVFEFRRRGKRSADPAADYPIFVYVQTRVQDQDWPVEAAVTKAQDKFGLSRKAVFQSIRRIKEILQLLGIVLPKGRL
jgi:hypothetical protein